MIILIRTLIGQTISVEVEGHDTILNVKQKVQQKEGIRIGLQRLMFGNKQLDNSRLVSSYDDIIDQSTLHLVLRAAQNTKTVAGGYEQGSASNQLSYPYGLAIYDDQTVIIADWGNHRIVKWNINGQNGEVIAGGHGQGNQLNQLNSPTDVLIDKDTDSIIICDRGNNRVVQWSLHEGTTEGKILLDNITCWGLAMDNEKFLYISDNKKNEVRRYKIGAKDDGTVVAGGHGRGAGLNKLNEPSYIFVDQQQSVYVSDTGNYRVMKWVKDAKEGIVVARGFSRGLVVDKLETIYMADYGNRRVMRWPKGAKEGTVFVTKNGEEEEENQLYYPWALSFDQHENLFVADHSNHRVQRFLHEQPA